MAFFNKGRRDLIAKTLATLVQIAAGGAIAGNIFLTMTFKLRVVSVVAVIVLFALAVIICPERSGE